MEIVPPQEIHQRIAGFQQQLSAHRLDGAFILQNADLFYFSGTIQSAVLFVPADGEPTLMVLKNLERAQHESSIKNIITVKNKSAVPLILNDFGFDRLKNIGLEIDGHLAMAARREGHMGLLRMRGWNQEMTYAHVLQGDSGATASLLNSPHGGNGNTPAMAQGAGFRRIQKNEPMPARRTF